MMVLTSLRKTELPELCVFSKSMENKKKVENLAPDNPTGSFSSLSLFRTGFPANQQMSSRTRHSSGSSMSSNLDLEDKKIPVFEDRQHTQRTRNSSGSSMSSSMSCISDTKKTSLVLSPVRNSLLDQKTLVFSDGQHTQRKRNSSGSSMSSIVSCMSDQKTPVLLSVGNNGQCTKRKRNSSGSSMSSSASDSKKTSVILSPVDGLVSNSVLPFRHNLRRNIRKKTCSCDCTATCTTLVVRRYKEIGVEEKTVISTTTTKVQTGNSSTREIQAISYEKTFSPTKSPDQNRKRRSEVEKLYDSLHEIKWAKNFSPDNILRQLNIRQAASSSLFGRTPDPKPSPQASKKQKVDHDQSTNNSTYPKSSLKKKKKATPNLARTNFVLRSHSKRGSTSEVPSALNCSATENKSSALKKADESQNKSDNPPPLQSVNNCLDSVFESSSTDSTNNDLQKMRENESFRLFCGSKSSAKSCLFESDSLDSSKSYLQKRECESNQSFSGSESTVRNCTDPLDSSKSYLQEKESGSIQLFSGPESPVKNCLPKRKSGSLKMFFGSESLDSSKSCLSKRESGSLQMFSGSESFDSPKSCLQKRENGECIFSESESSSFNCLLNLKSEPELDSNHSTESPDLPATFYDIAEEGLRTIDACFREVGAEVVISTCHEKDDCDLPLLTAVNLLDKRPALDDTPPILEPCISLMDQRFDVKVSESTFNKCLFWDTEPPPKLNFAGNVIEEDSLKSFEVKVSSDTSKCIYNKCLYWESKPPDLTYVEKDSLQNIIANTLTEPPDLTHIKNVIEEDSESKVGAHDNKSLHRRSKPLEMECKLSTDSNKRLCSGIEQPDKNSIENSSSQCIISDTNNKQLCHRTKPSCYTHAQYAPERESLEDRLFSDTDKRLSRRTKPGARALVQSTNTNKCVDNHERTKPSDFYRNVLEDHVSCEPSNITNTRPRRHLTSNFLTKGACKNISNKYLRLLRAKARKRINVLEDRNHHGPSDFSEDEPPFSIRTKVRTKTQLPHGPSDLSEDQSQFSIGNSCDLSTKVVDYSHQDDPSYLSDNQLSSRNRTSNRTQSGRLHHTKARAKDILDGNGLYHQDGPSDLSEDQPPFSRTSDKAMTIHACNQKVSERLCSKTRSNAEEKEPPPEDGPLSVCSSRTSDDETTTILQTCNQKVSYSSFPSERISVRQSTSDAIVYSDGQESFTRILTSTQIIQEQRTDFLNIQQHKSLASAAYVPTKVDVSESRSSKEEVPRPRSVLFTCHYETIKVSRQNSYTQVQLKLSRGCSIFLTVESLTELKDIFQRTGQDGHCHTLILNGIGDSFCMGLDLQPLLGPQKIKASTDIAVAVKEFIEALSNFKKPFVAVANGSAFGLGMTLLNHADISIASDAATFCLPQTSLGYFPEGGATLTLPQTVGSTVAMDLILRSRTITAQEAKNIGLVSEIMEAKRLPYDLVTRVKVLAENSLPSMETTKAMLKMRLHLELIAVLENEVKLLPKMWLSQSCQHALQHTPHSSWLFDE